MNVYEPNQSQRTWRRRRNQTAGSLIIALNQTKNKFQESSTHVVKSHRKLHTIKSKLLQCSLVVQEHERELKLKRDDYRRSIKQLEAEIIGGAQDSLSDEGKISHHFAQVDLFNALNLIKSIDRELNKKDIIVHKDNSNKNETSTSEAPLPLSIELPDIDSNDFIKKKGYFELDYTRKCCTCLENEIDSLFYQCRHQCCCFTCAKKLIENKQKCPVCRLLPKKVIKTYLI